MSHVHMSCANMIHILGAEYHYHLSSRMPNTDLKLFFHFFQKIFSIFLLVIYFLYFYRTRKQVGLKKMMDETVFHYLDGISDELVEEVNESTSIFYDRALKQYKKRIHEIEKHQENTDLLYNNEESTRINNRKKYSSPSLFLKKPKKKHVFRSKTNYSLYSIIDYKPRMSARHEFISNNEDIDIISDNKKSSFCIEMDHERIIEKIYEKPELNDYKGKLEHIETRASSLNPALDIYRNFYICNCYECCCECCCDCWFQYIFYVFYSVYQRFKQKTLLFLINNAKKLCFIFIIAGVFFEMTLRNSTAILVSDCLERHIHAFFKIFIVIFSLVDLISSASFSFAIVFLVSFLCTRREFLKVNPRDKQARGRMIFYHLNKALVYGVLHLVFQLIYRTIFLYQRPFYELDEGSDTVIFCLLKYSFLFLFIVHNYHNWKRTILIQEDCDILKFQNRYFAIQNIFLKFLPNEKTLLKFLKFYIYGKNRSNSSFMSDDTPRAENTTPVNSNIINDFVKDLDMNLCYVKLQLNEQLNIIEKQKFKRILRNRGLYPTIQLIIVYVLLITSAMNMVIGSIILIRENTEYEYSEGMYSMIYFCIFIFNIIECTLFPLMFKYTLKRSYYLDFEEETQQQWLEDENI